MVCYITWKGVGRKGPVTLPGSVLRCVPLDKGARSRLVGNNGNVKPRTTYGGALVNESPAPKTTPSTYASTSGNYLSGAARVYQVCE